MDGIQVRVEGVPAVARALTGLGSDLDDLHAGTEAIAREGAARVRRHVPVRTRRLAGSVRGEVAGPNHARITVGERPRLRYAGPVNARARFKERADAEIAPRAVVELESQINATIRKRGLNA